MTFAKSNGLAIAVSDLEILDAQKDLGFKEGIFAAPEGAATIAALIKLIEQRQVGTHERIVCFNTGSGLKYLN